jgi:single-strand DNA-binding protein
MANFNQVILIGNLTRDPELRYLPKGTAVAKFGLAVNRTWKTETGESREEVTFIDIDAFGRQAETICQYLKKGRPVLVQGRLKLDTWDDKQTGQKRSKLGVLLENFQFLGSRPEGEGDAAPRPSRPSSPAAATAAAAPAVDNGAPPETDGPPADDDVPF